jgi:hypothetical protein
MSGGFQQGSVQLSARFVSDPLQRSCSSSEEMPFSIARIIISQNKDMYIKNSVKYIP